MARVTRSQTQPTAADRQESQGAAASTGKKRKQSANKDEPVSKRPKAVQPKTNGTKSQVPPKKVLIISIDYLELQLTPISESRRYYY